MLLTWVRNITNSDELHDIWSLLPAAWLARVRAVRVSRVTQYVTEKRFGLVMTHARRPCLFYSQRWCEKDETESGWQEREERKHMHADVNGFYSQWAGTTMRLYIHSHVSAVTPLISTNWVWIHVKHVVITRIRHESAPRGAALLLPRLSDHHWNNTATQWLDHLPLDKTQGWPKYTRAALSPAWHLHHNWAHEYQLRFNTLEEKWLHPQI